MNNFPWTDEMVKEVVRASRSIIYYDHQANTYEQRLHNLIEQYKIDTAPELEGTFERKLYWSVNPNTFTIMPCQDITDEDFRYTTNYTDALHLSIQLKNEKTKEEN
jgi:hypothetical protein